MPYIMVPVPEEHVAEVMEHIVKLTTRANLQPWDHEAVEALFMKVEESSRSVLSAVARRTLGGDELTDEALAQLVELTRKEAVGVIRLLNGKALRRRRTELVKLETIAEVGPDARTREKRIVGMAVEVAEMIRAAEEVERAMLPHPLQRSSG
jgi:hypothetical protein